MVLPWFRCRRARVARRTRGDDRVSRRKMGAADDTWPGRTRDQRRELVLELAYAVAEAECLAAIPGDEWLDARLRDRGCPESQLSTWRTIVQETPLAAIADRSSWGRIVRTLRPRYSRQGLASRNRCPPVLKRKIFFLRSRGGAKFNRCSSLPGRWPQAKTLRVVRS